MRHELTEKQLSELTEELRAGRKVRAIGVYRNATGLGLRESKKEVESIEVMLHNKYPDEFPAKPNRKGCSVSTGIGCLVAGLLLFLIYR